MAHDNDNLNRNMQQGKEDLKAKNEELAQIGKEEKENSEARKRPGQFVIDRTVKKARLEDSNSNSECADAVEFLSQKKPLKVDIEFANIFSIKSLHDASQAVDVLAIRENIVAVCFTNYSGRFGRTHHVQLYLLDDQKGMTKKGEFYEDFIQGAAYSAGKSFVILSRTKLKTWHITDDLKLLPSLNNHRFWASYRNVSAMTCHSSSTLAFASASRIMVGTKKKVHKRFERYPGFFNYFMRLYCPPILDMCFLRDDSLVFCDSTGVHRLNPLSGTFTVFSDIKTIVSVAGYKDSYFFALDSATNRLLMFGPEGRKPSKTWSMDSQLRSEDQLLRISVCKDRLVCITKFGFVLAFRIKCEEMDD